MLSCRFEILWVTGNYIKLILVLQFFFHWQKVPKSKFVQPYGHQMAPPASNARPFFQNVSFSNENGKNTSDKSVVVQDLFRVREISPPPNSNFFLVFPTKYKWKKPWGSQSAFHWVSWRAEPPGLQLSTFSWQVSPTLLPAAQREHWSVTYCTTGTNI